MIQTISKMILSLCGWKTDYKDPCTDKYVLIGAPHTTNWDFPWTLLSLASMGVKFNWVAKHTLFKWPFGLLLKAIGGIPVDRSSGTRFLKKTIELYQELDHFILAIAPEGTRSETRYWKTGFYTIAQQAGVPIVLGYIDYPSKTIGVGEMIVPTGDIEHDFEIIKAFYQDKTGKYPDKQGEINIKIRKKSRE